ncbi:hypothetical protein [Rubrivirga marina]|uniref:Uncharacterized protein n=1 Tax=Rubrivirga marina TaxID=1196024 RepID=A0A271J3Z2_9BACT|nr:hypothetical protein [Rubrivirga marina]PAP78007.1 hypothetical protein BSZ37_16950 [Rubrivirga marina]
MDRPTGLDDRARDDLDRIADEMEADGLPRSADLLRVIVHPDRWREWEMAGARTGFAWGVATGVGLTLAVMAWAYVVRQGAGG